ncbi:hypothetical protein AAVH_33429, partial [Aphelenchoides avenae]
VACTSTALSGLLFVGGWLPFRGRPPFLSQCAFTMLTKVIGGFGILFTWCSGVPLLFGYTRPRVHPHVRHLMGGV